jgi:hypothetical protein
MPWVTPNDVPAMRGWAELEIVKVALFAGILDGGAIHVANGDVAARRIVGDFRQVSRSGSRQFGSTASKFWKRKALSRRRASWTIGSIRCQTAIAKPPKR